MKVELIACQSLSGLARKLESVLYCRKQHNGGKGVGFKDGTFKFYPALRGTILLMEKLVINESTGGNSPFLSFCRILFRQGTGKMRNELGTLPPSAIQERGTGRETISWYDSVMKNTTGDAVSEDLYTDTHFTHVHITAKKDMFLIKNHP